MKRTCADRPWGLAAKGELAGDIEAEEAAVAEEVVVAEEAAVAEEVSLPDWKCRSIHPSLAEPGGVCSVLPASCFCSAWMH